MPDTNEGYLMSSRPPQKGCLQHSAPLYSYPPAMPYGVTGANAMVPSHLALSVDSAGTYSPCPGYLPGDGYMVAHGFGGGGEAGMPYAYEALAPAFAVPAASTVAVQPGGDGVPSIGSYAHLAGQCSRCCFHPKGRCANGYSCSFCHFDHDKRPRNGKKKRYRRQGDEAGECLDE